jgi:uncharacterized protein (TIGR02145 family)
VACKKVTNTSNNNLINKNDTVINYESYINFNSSTNPIGVFQNNLTDIDGNLYKTVKIGTQTWMAENLKTSSFSDGTEIPYCPSSLSWTISTKGAWSYYNSDSINNRKYGKLYNWYAVSPTSNGNKNLCPIGWHVPSDEDWTILSDYLGGDTVSGGKLKEIGAINWANTNINVSNSSLFTGLPGGSRRVQGNYINLGYGGQWWTTIGNYFNIGSLGIGARIYPEDKRVGLSVRCIRD